MTSRHWLALACLVVGVPLAAWGLANGLLLVGLGGIAMVLVFVALVWQWIAGADRPMGAEGRITPAANPAWSMKDEPVSPGEQRK